MDTMAPPCLQDPVGAGSASTSVSGSSSTSSNSSSSSTECRSRGSSSTLRHRSVATKKASTATSNQSQQQQQQQLATPTWSANIVFYPPSKDYWRIGRQWYDLSSFPHPGGQQILELARDRFEDATFAFEAHHHNYEKARKILNQYKLPPLEQERANQQALRRPTRRETQSLAQQHLLDHYPNEPHHDAQLDQQHLPTLLGHDAFYSVLRRRVARYLASVDCPEGEPTWECVSFFWICFTTWLSLMGLLYVTARFVFLVPAALVSAILRSFGHNWVHQPKYKDWGWALLSLDVNGFSSEGWYRDHVLHHHMFTNTPWDHHYFGTDPFLKTDPTAPRNFMQQYVTPNLFHVILSFGTYGNYAIHTLHLLQGQEVWSIGKSFFLLEHALFYHRWGFHGLLLLFSLQAIMANYYFTMALMNHNAEHCLNVSKRNNAQDWGQAQLISSADWSVHLSFRQSTIYLWLNFHTVHHCKCLFCLFVCLFVG